MRINLLPWRQQQQQRLQLRWLALAILSAIICTGGALYIQDCINARRKILTIHDQQLHPALPTFTTQHKQTLPLVLEKIARERKNLMLALNTIIKALPAGCYFTKLQYHQHWVIQGNALDMLSLNRFVLNLNQTHLFHRVMLVNIVKKRFFIFTIRVIS